MFRPEKMTWIDLVLDSDSCTTMLECVAESGLMQIERIEKSLIETDSCRIDARDILRTLRIRMRAFSSELPVPEISDTIESERLSPVSKLVPDLTRRVESWLTAAAKITSEQHEVAIERKSLAMLGEVLGVLPDDFEPGLWHSAGDRTRRYYPVIAVGDQRAMDQFAASNLATDFRFSREDSEDLGVVVGIFSSAEDGSLDQQLQQYRLSPINVPEWLQGRPAECIDKIEIELKRLGDRNMELEQVLRSSAEENHVAGARWLIERQFWFENAMEKAERGLHFVHVGGWIPRNTFQRLVQQLEQTGHPFLVRIDAPDQHGAAPSLLNNPAWVKPFENFVTGFGTPRGDEVDPSLPLAIITPLMFGYMFGDVGQGAILLFTGLIFWNRITFLRLLVPAGVSAVLFGFMYGSVFSAEHLIPALWLHPMDHPLIVLGVPLIFGVLLMMLSLFFGFLGAYWRDAAGQWLLEEGPLVLCYLAAPAFFLHMDLALVLLVSALFIVIFARWRRLRSEPRTESKSPKQIVTSLSGGLLLSIAELFEKWLQLNINTLSFVRLGAFSLAHAGLSNAVVAVSTLSESKLIMILVLIVGNIFIIALEGLVVSIQTTRLVMFEFFRRFLEASGRRFDPLTLDQHPGMKDDTNGT